MTDNRLLSVRIGKIIQADPVLNMYYVLANGGRKLPNGTIKGEVIPATTIGSTTTNTKTVTDRYAYPVGTSVLFVHEADSINSNGIEIAVIIGSLAGNIDSSYKTCVKLNAPENGLSFYNANFPQIHRTQYQNITPLRDFSGNGPTDIWYGEWAKQGANTLLLLGNDRFTLNTGVCSIHMDGITRRLTIDTALLSQKTLVNAVDTRLINNNAVFTEKVAGSGYAARTSELSSNADNATSIEKYRYIRQASDVTGSDERFVLSDDGKPLANTSMRYDGQLCMKSAKGISIEHTLNMKHYKYNGNVIDVSEKLESLNWHELIHSDAHTLDDFVEGWGISTLKEAETRYIEPSEDAGESMTDDVPIAKTKISINEITEEYEFVDNTSGFYITPTGTIIIRDAWGSEIRMTNGNIQIAAANTLSMLSGRDTVMLQGGVLSMNAVKGVDIAGVNGTVLVKGPNVKLAAGDKNTKGVLSLEAPAGEVIVAGDNHVAISATNVDIVSTSINNPNTQGSVTVLSNGNLILGSDRDVIVSAKYTASIASQYSHLDLSDTITMNCVGGKTIIGGILYVEPVLSYAPVISVQRQQIESQKYQTTFAKFETSGAVFLTGEGGLRANGFISTAGTIFGNTIVAKNVANKGVYKSKKPPVKVRASYKAEAYGDDRGLPDKIFEYLKSVHNRSIFAKLFSFNKKAKGCVIYEPSYSEQYSTKIPINAATHVDNNGKVSYIYPGDRFWKTDGLCQTDLSVTADIDTMLNCKYVGASKLNVLPSSVVEKED